MGRCGTARLRRTARARVPEGAPGAGRKRKPGGQRVYLLGKDGKPVPVPIKTGVSNGTYTVLEEGNLKEGDALVTGESQEKKAAGNAPPPGMGMGGFR